MYPKRRISDVSNLSGCAKAMKKEIYKSLKLYTYRLAPSKGPNRVGVSPLT
jgi:hypothetical protein